MGSQKKSIRKLCVMKTGASLSTCSALIVPVKGAIHSPVPCAQSPVEPTAWGGIRKGRIRSPPTPALAAKGWRNCFSGIGYQTRGKTFN